MVIAVQLRSKKLSEDLLCESLVLADSAVFDSLKPQRSDAKVAKYAEVSDSSLQNYELLRFPWMGLLLLRVRNH